MGCSASTESKSVSGSKNSSNYDQRLYTLSKRTLDKREQAILRAENLFAQTKGRHFHDNYVRTTLVSYGASCKVLTAVHRQSNKKYAAKAIPKDFKNLEKQRYQVLLEVGVMKEVEDHPNAVGLFEVYDEARQYYIVMEYCEGGELFDHISKSMVGLTERQAAQILTSIMQFLVHMHSRGIAHMDIKPENIMFDSEGAQGILKIIDFGASVFVAPNEQVKDAFGTVRYSSPEMANDAGIGHKTDVWSAGVVMYVMLCGSPPFIKGSDVDTLNFIKKAPKVKFGGNRWGHISLAAKDCIRAMLDPDPRNRPTAAEVLNHQWLKTTVPDTSIKPDILAHLRAFANQSRMRRMLLGLMASNLTGGEANRLLSQFYMVDTDSSGTIELPELVQAAQKVLPDISEEEVAKVFNALDVDDTGSIDLREFFAGLLHTMDSELQSQLALKSFHNLDPRSAGYVARDAFVGSLLQRAKTSGLCLSHEEEDSLKQELELEFRALDVNNDGVLTFEEYKAALNNTIASLSPSPVPRVIAPSNGPDHGAAAGGPLPMSPVTGVVVQSVAGSTGVVGPSSSHHGGPPEERTLSFNSLSGQRQTSGTSQKGLAHSASSRILTATHPLEELVLESTHEALATSHQNFIRLALEVTEQQRTKSGRCSSAMRAQPSSNIPMRHSSTNLADRSPRNSIGCRHPNPLAQIVLPPASPPLPPLPHLSSSAPQRAHTPLAAGNAGTTARDASGNPSGSNVSLPTLPCAVPYHRSCSHGHGHSQTGFDPHKEAAMHAVASLLERQRVSPQDAAGAGDTRRSAPARPGTHRRSSAGEQPGVGLNCLPRPGSRAASGQPLLPPPAAAQ